VASPHLTSSRAPEDLFDASEKARTERDAPLAARMRPRTLDEFLGQGHILGEGRLLRRAIQADQLSSLLFYGPPGTGKTTLAAVIANTTSSHFISLNAVLAGVADIRSAVEDAQERHKFHSQRTILFVDEVHRFNKAQQDALLPWVENGTVILIGATTENPYFSVNRPLLSRSRIFQLESLEAADLRQVALQALKDDRGFSHLRVEVEETALNHLVDVSNGDARALLNALELAVETTLPDGDDKILIDLGVAEESIQRRAVLYDKEGDYHFDTVSAFIKSMRGSDPDATMYWLARMVYAGEDPHFLLRRMIIFAGEDIGLADPTALSVAVAAAAAFDRVGLPEGRFHLAEAALYLATAAKSNSVFAFFDALASVEAEKDSEVPNHLKDASRDSEGFGHGANYLYPHAYRDHWVEQQYLPQGLAGRVFYEPSDQGHEARIRDQVQRRRELQLAAMVDGQDASPEILTHTPEDRTRDQWLKRIADDAGAHLGVVRERLFRDLDIQRHDLIIDLNAGTGLLTWEAMRKAPEGGVWSVCPDRTAAVALHELSSRLPEVERPNVLQCGLPELRKTLEEAGTKIEFGFAVGRNALGGLSTRGEVVADLAELLAANGRVSIFEIVQRRAQRLCDLVDLEDSDLQDRIAEAEEAIYASTENPHVGWDSLDMEELFAGSGFAEVEVRPEEMHSTRRITAQQIGQWFSSGGEKNPTYAWHLSRNLTQTEVNHLRHQFERQLGNKEVEWKAAHLYLSARKAG
jgi:putative ATPase